MAEENKEVDKGPTSDGGEVRFSECCFGFLLVFTAFCVYVPVAGFVNSFGVFVEMFDRDFCQPDDCLELLGLVSALAIANFRVLCWLQVFLEQYTSVPVLFGIGSILCFLSMLLTSYINNVYMLLLTHSLLYGFGSTFMLNAPVSAIGHYFPEGHRFHVLASGIINLGPSVGVVVMNPLSVYLDSTEKYSWRDTLSIFSIAIFVVATIHLLVLTRLYISRHKRDTYEQLPDNGPGGESSDKNKSSQWNLKNWGNIASFSWLLGIFCVGGSLYIPKTLYMKYLVGLNNTESDSARLLAFGGVAETGFSLVVSLTGDLMGNHLMLVYAIGSLVLTVSHAIIPFFTGQLAQGIYIVVTGACDGLLMTVLFGVVTLISPTRQGHPTLWCLTNLVVGVGQIVSLPIAGLIYDHTKSYNPIFIMSSASFGVGAILFSVAYVRRLLKSETQTKSINHPADNPTPVSGEDDK